MAAGSKNMKGTIQVNPNAPITSTVSEEPLGYQRETMDCRHEWRIIENFHEELPRDLSKPRVYAAYCIYCLQSKGVEIKINQ